MNVDDCSVRPFLKWAGGKRWLVSSYLDLFPCSYERYIEPFLGGGAVFFSMGADNAILGDVNQDLIDTYSAIKTNWKKVVDLLAHHQNRHSEMYYYKIRAQGFTNKVERAARLIYLNRTCWNGLYRVNKIGKFNVPIGTKSQVLYENDDFRLWSKSLSGAQLLCTDFENLVEKAEWGDFLFADPPYTVAHNYNGFIKYNESLFSWQDQERLFESLRRAKKRGVKIIVTNAYHKSIRSLYSKDFNLEKLKRFSGISGESQFRKNIEEYFITANLG